MASIRAEKLVKRYGAFQAVHASISKLPMASSSPFSAPRAAKVFDDAYDRRSGDDHRGAIYFDGRRVNDVRARDRNVAMSFESYAVYPTISIYENIAFRCVRPMSTTGKSTARFRDIARDGADAAPEPQGRRASPSGQAQRVGWHGRWLRNPAVFLLDEPISHLDTRQRYRMRRFIKSFTRSSATP